MYDTIGAVQPLRQMAVADLFIQPLWRFMVIWNATAAYFIRRPELVC